MKYIVLGLGDFGRRLALELTKVGNEVIGADINPDLVDSIKDNIATAFIMDTTNPHSLAALPFKDIDAVIVAIGKDIGASIKTVALLKQNKIDNIYARSIDDIHTAILHAFNLKGILTPERYSAEHIVQNLDFGTGVMSYKINNDYSIIKFAIPPKMEGVSLNKITLQDEFNLKIISLLQAENIINAVGISVTDVETKNSLPQDYTLAKGDIIVCYGLMQDFRKFWKTIS